jgi:hypothetical protein
MDIPTPYFLWAGSLVVMLLVFLCVLVLVWGDRAFKRIRARAEEQYKEFQAQSERSLALQQQMLETAQESARKQDMIIQLLRKLIERQA